jgi:hypothetical protein
LILIAASGHLALGISRLTPEKVPSEAFGGLGQGAVVPVDGLRVVSGPGFQAFSGLSQRRMATGRYGF